MFFFKTNDRCLIYGFWEIHCFSTVFGKISILKLNTIQGSVDVMSPLLQILPLFICLSLCHVGYFKYIVGLLYSVFFYLPVTDNNCAEFDIIKYICGVF